MIEYNGSPMDVRITSDSHSLKLDNENGRPVCRLKLTVLAHTSLDIRDEKSSDQVAALVKQRLEENITGCGTKPCMRTGRIFLMCGGFSVTNIRKAI